jgi:hypothetical protein
MLNESSHLYLFVWLNADVRLALCSYPCFIEKWRQGVSWSCLQTTESAPFMVYMKQDVIARLVGASSSLAIRNAFS